MEFNRGIGHTIEFNRGTMEFNRGIGPTMKFNRGRWSSVGVRWSSCCVIQWN